MTSEKRMAALRRSTTIITRNGEDLDGSRLITNEAATVYVRTFPYAGIAKEIATGDLGVGATYVLANHHLLRGYVGSASELDSRLKQHAGDPDKSFATHVFAICGAGSSLDYEAAVHMERLLKHSIEAAGVARLLNRVQPRAAKLAQSRLISVERKFVDAQVLLHDAGLRWLVPNPTPELTAAVQTEAANSPPPLVVGVGNESEEETEDEGPMEIGVTVVPIGVEEQTLAFSNLWARGYQYGDRFIVAAGSEMRGEANPSANQPTRDRRDRLIKTGAAKIVDGADDRYRLELAVAFPSRAIAAKVLAGAHVGSEKWRALRTERPCVIAH